MNVSVKKSIWMVVLMMVALLVAVSLVGCGDTSGEDAEDESDDTTTAAESADDADETADLTFIWTVDADCSLCHSTESDSMSDSTYLASVHSVLGCTDCHTDEEALAEAHADVTLADTDGTSKLRSTTVDESTCLTCHDEATLAELTADCTVLTDSEGTTVNPHDLTSSTSHDTVTCTSCHTMHDDDSLETTAAKTCTKCHHQNVYECYTCHD